MAQAADEAEPTGLRLGEGEYPMELDRVNFGAFLLGVIWAPFHRLWRWLGVFAVLEVLESALGLGALRFFGGASEQTAALVAFRVVYWTVTVVFALRANRLVWAQERKRSMRPTGDSILKRPSPVSRYVSNERGWTVVGLILLAATPLFLLIGSVSGSRSAAMDVAVTVGTQAILLVGLWAYDRVRIARRRARG